MQLRILILLVVPIKSLDVGKEKLPTPPQKLPLNFGELHWQIIIGTHYGNILQRLTSLVQGSRTHPKSLPPTLTAFDFKLHRRGHYMITLNTIQPDE